MSSDELKLYRLLTLVDSKSLKDKVKFDAFMQLLNDMDLLPSEGCDLNEVQVTEYMLNTRSDIDFNTFVALVAWLNKSEELMEYFRCSGALSRLCSRVFVILDKERAA